MISSESSLRLNLLRFPLIVGVVFIHASATKVGFSGGEVGLSQPVLSLILLGISSLVLQQFLYQLFS